MDDTPFSSGDIDRRCVAFERAWFAGERPRLADHAQAGPAHDRLFLELLLVELELRRRAGEMPAEGEYLVRFSERTDLIRVAFAEPPRPAEPRRLGEYDLLQELGKGGMGVVFKARQRAYGRLVALKVVRADVLGSLPLAARALLLERFRTEARAAARLQHPNVVEVFEVGCANGTPFFAMRLVDGDTLEDLVARGPLPGRRAAELLEPVARAVQHAHSRGVLHRDLKPCNVLCSGDGTPFVADFGLAKCVEETSGLTLSGQVVGTPAYLAPERGDGASATTATDVYGLGATLYALLVGRAPFDGSGVVETLHRVRYDEPVPPRRIVPQVERDLEVICLKCLEKEPGRRYASADELADELRRFLQGEPIRARPVSLTERVVKWARRNPLVAALAATALLFLIGGVGGVVWQWRDATAERDRAKAERDRAEATLYARHVVGSQKEWDRCDVREAARLLDLCLPKPGQVDRRGWEWHYLRRLVNPDRVTLNKHRDWAISVAYAPDGRLLASGGGDPTDSSKGGELFVWDADKGTLQASLDGHRWPVVAIGFSPDGRRLASGGTRTPDSAIPGELFLWDLVGHRLAARFPGTTAGVISVAFAPDGKAVAAGCGDGSLVIWDLVSGRERLPRHNLEGRLSGVGWLPDGRSLVARADGCLAWLVEEGKSPRRLSDNGSAACGFAVRPDGRTVAAAQRYRIHLVPVAGGANRVLFGHDGNINSLAWRPDGCLLASASADSTVRIWDAATGETLRTFRGHRAGVRTVAFHPDGRFVASAGQDGAIKVWDTERDQEALRLANDERTDWGGRSSMALAFSADGDRVTLLRHDGKVRTWDVATGAQTSEVALPRQMRLRWPYHEAALSANGAGLLFVDPSDRTTIRLGDVFGGRSASFRVGARPIASASLSPDGTRLAATSSAEGRPGGPSELKLWDVASGRELRCWQPHDFGVCQIAFAADGRRLATAGFQGHLRLWDAEGKSLFDLSHGDDCVSTAAFSPDGSLVVAGAYERGGVRVWDVHRGRLVAELEMPPQVTQVAFSPDGRRLAAVNLDLVKLWDAASWNELLTLRGRERRMDDLAHNARVAFSPDGRRLAWTSWDHVVNVADAGR